MVVMAASRSGQRSRATHETVLGNRDASGSPSAASVAACIPAETLNSLAILNSHRQLDGTAHCSRLPILETIQDRAGISPDRTLEVWGSIPHSSTMKGRKSRRFPALHIFGPTFLPRPEQVMGISRVRLRDLFIETNDAAMGCGCAS